MVTNDAGLFVCRQRGLIVLLAISIKLGQS